MVIYARAKKSTRFHQIASNKRSKTKFPGGACPRTPLVATCFAHRFVLAPPIIHTISFGPPLAKKLKENLLNMSDHCPVCMGEVE